MAESLDTLRTGNSGGPVSAHYLIGRDGALYQLVSDDRRAWHAGPGRWGTITDVNSASIGIELDNDGASPFPPAQIAALLRLLDDLCTRLDIPRTQVIAHADMAPTRKRDPGHLFPWRQLAEAGFGRWPDSLDREPPPGFDPMLALRLLGYVVDDPAAATRAFHLHYRGIDDDAMPLDATDARILFALVAPDKAAQESIAQAAERLAVRYGQQQMQRLAKKGGRDNLIAAALAGLPVDAKAVLPQDHAGVLRRLITEYPTDALALYAAALICNTRPATCTEANPQSALVRLAPQNAVHFLLLPAGQALGEEQLHRAAQTDHADTHFSELLGIVRAALENQPAPDEAVPPLAPVDRTELALLMRRNVIATVPWPNYAPVLALCNAATAASATDPQRHVDCVRLGNALFADAADNIVSRMVGGSMVRRFAKASAAEAAATDLRRRYVWLSEQLPEKTTSAEHERLNAEEIRLGEWEAYQRHAERAGIQRTPPRDWVPGNPDALLLPEERPAQPGGG